MNNLCATKVTAIGGRSGTIKSEDGTLDPPLAMPTELGGKGGATNPEQLFAAGYAACFGNAVIHVTRAQADTAARGEPPADALRREALVERIGRELVAEVPAIPRHASAVEQLVRGGGGERPA